MLKLSENLYHKLPNIYRAEDSKIQPSPYPLQRFLKILGSGMDFIEGKISEYEFINDIDRCPVELLPYVAQTMGVDIPYGVTEMEQRRFLKALPFIFKMKGTADAFKYLAKEFFGIDTVTNAYLRDIDPQSPMTPPTIFVRAEVNGEQLFLGTKLDIVRQFYFGLRPVNTLVVLELALFYADIFDPSKIAELGDSSKLTMTTSEIYSKVKSDLDFSRIVYSDIDSYNRGSKASILSTTSKIVYDDKTETYEKGRITSISSLKTFMDDKTEIYTKKANGDDSGTTKAIYTRPHSRLLTSSKLVTSFHTNNGGDLSLVNY